MKNQFHMKSYLLGVLACAFAFYLTDFIFPESKAEKIEPSVEEKEEPCPCLMCVKKRQQNS